MQRVFAVFKAFRVTAKSLSGALFVSLALWGMALTPGPAAAQAIGDRGAAYTFAFQDAPIAQAADEVFGALGVAYTIDPSVTGTLSFRIDQKLTKAQLLQAFEAALLANNVALVRNGESLVVTSKTRARASASVRPYGDGAMRAGYEIVAVPLSFATASEVGKALQAISGDGIVLHTDDRLGLIVLAGAGRELQATLETLKVFDQSGLHGSRIRWFDLSQAPAASVAAELEAMIKASGASGISVIPLKRLNGLIVIGRTETALEDIAPWVTRFDVPIKDTASSLWIYRPKNTSAEALAKTLNAVVNGTGASLTNAPSASTSSPVSTGVEGGGPLATSASSADPVEAVRAAVDKDTNTLLVSAPGWRWTQIQRILEEIDRPQSQVLIEASIIEVTLSDDFRFGVDWRVLGNDGHIAGSLIGNVGGQITPTYPGFNLTFIDTDVQAAVKALGARTAVEVVSAPKMLTLDNRTARLQVGDQVPIVTQTSQGVSTGDAPIINNVDYRNSGVILSVTPRISGEDRIVLEVSQEVSSVVRTETSGINSPTIQQRRFESTLVVRNGGVVAVGGLISRSRNRGNSGIPGVKDIPVLGRLFQSSTNDVGRTELIVLLSAKILKDSAQTDRAMQDLLADMTEIQARGLLDAPS
jgi:general secretion pathway protein D